MLKAFIHQFFFLLLKLTVFEKLNTNADDHHWTLILFELFQNWSRNRKSVGFQRGNICRISKNTIEQVSTFQVTNYTSLRFFLSLFTSLSRFPQRLLHVVLQNLHSTVSLRKKIIAKSCAINVNFFHFHSTSCRSCRLVSSLMSAWIDRKFMNQLITYLRQSIRFALFELRC